MKVLVACEESQAVCKAFRARGHEAFSCDIQECSGGHPEWHIQSDVIPHLKDGWDLVIAHPPCTYFGDAYSKRTCLWLFNLPKLVPDNVVECKSLCQYGWYDHAPKGVPRSVWRSKTAPGIARAMAEQWGCY